MKRFRAWFVGVVKYFLDCDCPLHAAGLTYFSLLALVPALCVLLFVAKTCGVDSFARDQINVKLNAMILNVEQGQNEQLVKWFADTGTLSAAEMEKKRIAAVEFGETARNVTEQLFDRINRFDIGTLGWIGFLFLLWTVISTLGTVETSFNRIWQTGTDRPLWKRIWMYLLMATVLPVFAAIAASIAVLGMVKSVVTATLGATWLTKWASDGLIWLLETRLLSFTITYATATLTFAVFYWVMPNCRVQALAALIGGAVTALLFGGWIKICAIAQVGIANASALYGTFAILPIVLAWMYMSWQIVLFGACLTKRVEGLKG